MITLKCPECGEKVLWDDFQPAILQCPICKKQFSVHQGLKDNIRRREEGEQKLSYRCPFCRGFISKRWFTLCPKCGKYVFGKHCIHPRWFWISAFITAYLLFTLYYVVVIK
jgi:DNA-directed RNA polymerase subunit RPC12/RpoP